MPGDPLVTLCSRPTRPCRTTNGRSETWGWRRWTTHARACCCYHYYHQAMAQLIVRSVDDEVVKRRAAERWRSAEAEHRDILKEALLPRRAGHTIKEALLRMPAGGDDADFERAKDRGRKVAL